MTLPFPRAALIWHCAAKAIDSVKPVKSAHKALEYVWNDFRNREQKRRTPWTDTAALGVKPSTSFWLMILIG